MNDHAALIERLRAAELDYTVEWGSGDLYGEAASALASLPPVPQAEGAGWISVEDRLPEVDTGEVLVWLTGDRCAFDEWHTHHEDPTGLGGRTLDMGPMWRDYEFEDITHWMPLPAAPGAAPPAAAEVPAQPLTAAPGEGREAYYQHPAPHPLLADTSFCIAWGGEGAGAEVVHGGWSAMLEAFARGIWMDGAKDAEPAEWDEWLESLSDIDDYWLTDEGGEPYCFVSDVGEISTVSIYRVATPAPTASAAEGPSREEGDAGATLRGRITELSLRYGSLRALAEAIGVDVSYLSRLASGEKDSPSDSTLKALGLERKVTYALA